MARGIIPLLFIVSAVMQVRLCAAADDYAAFVPKNITSRTKVSVLVALPGTGVTAREDIEHWTQTAGMKGFVIVDLEMDYSRIASSEDIEAVHGRIGKIISALARRYPVDRSRVFITGTSAGGMMAIALGMRHPETFAAVGVVSGAHLRFVAEEDMPRARGVHFFMVHGTADTVVPLRIFTAAVETLEKNGGIVRSVARLDEGHPVTADGYQWVAGYFSGFDTAGRGEF